jgi:hypothetical protein
MSQKPTDTPNGIRRAVIEPRADRPRRVTLGFDMQRHIHDPQLIDEVFGMAAKAKGSAIVL